ncbi:MAG: hypothetical protein AAFP84_07700, partial [Actinomycetota bacterium]
MGTSNETEHGALVPPDGEYGGWDWMQILAAVSGGAGNNGTAPNTSALPETMWTSAQYLVNIQDTYGHMMNDVRFATEQLMNEWRGPAAAGFHGAVESIYDKLRAQHEQISGGVSGAARPVWAQVHEIGNRLATAQARVAYIVNHYSNEAIRHGAGTVPSVDHEGNPRPGVVTAVISDVPEAEEMMTNDLRAEMESVGTDYSVSAQRITYSDVAPTSYDPDAGAGDQPPPPPPPPPASSTPPPPGAEGGIPPVSGPGGLGGSDVSSAPPGGAGGDTPGIDPVGSGPGTDGGPAPTSLNKASVPSLDGGAVGGPGGGPPTAGAVAGLPGFGGSADGAGAGGGPKPPGIAGLATPGGIGGPGAGAGGIAAPTELNRLAPGAGGPVLGPDGRPVPGLFTGPNGSVVDADGRPVAGLSTDAAGNLLKNGQPISPADLADVRAGLPLAGGKPVLGPDGKRVPGLMVTPDGKVRGLDGKPIPGLS